MGIATVVAVDTSVVLDVAAAIGTRVDIVDTMARLGIDRDVLDRWAAIDAGSRWGRYRDAGGARVR